MVGVRGFVGVTDNSWYRLLADRPDLLGEVNFWRPGGGGFQALRPGEPFFFKTHAPHNREVFAEQLAADRIPSIRAIRA
jgi:putative restriction endonuclease